MVEVGDQPPDPARCQSQDDLGRLHHDEVHDIWYECRWDPSNRVYTWAILPPFDDVSHDAN